MATKRKRKKKNQKTTQTEKILKYVVWALSAVAVTLVLFLGGYYFGYSNAKEDIAKELSKKEQARKKALSKLQHVLDQKQSIHKELEQLLQKEQKKKQTLTAAHEIEDTKALKPPKKQQTTHYNNKPKLAIIFDDVSNPSQIKAIHALGLKVTLSFFPPSPHHPHTPELAKKERFYMVHLPMEALHFNKEEPFTLHANDSYATIQKRITKITQLFPKVHFINNHTGSKFTSDTNAVRRLLRVLHQKNITFIDSRTTAQTKVPQVSKEMGLSYVARDVFLDHQGDVASIKKQIKQAVQRAKRYGSVIAIGHPHPNTLIALAQSKKLLQQVDLVYVSELHH